MTRPILTLAALGTALIAMAGPLATPAQAWMHGTWGAGGGSAEHTSWNGDRSTSVSGSGWSHNSDYGWNDRSSSGNWQGSASRTVSNPDYTRGSSVSPGGWSHSSDYGGYYHGTSGNYSGTVSHTGYYGTTTGTYGGYYHYPAAVPYYGATCAWCRPPVTAWGAAAAGAAVGATAGVVAGAAAASAAPPPPAYAPPPPPPPVAAPVTYAVLPPGCEYRPLVQRYACPGGAWFAPAYGANGVYYTMVPPP